jgi:hypothetical protein
MNKITDEQRENLLNMGKALKARLHAQGVIDDVARERRARAIVSQGGVYDTPTPYPNMFDDELSSLEAEAHEVIMGAEARLY